jgi:hypothetical protein
MLLIWSGACQQACLDAVIWLRKARTFGHVRKFVLAHSLQGRALELALQLRWDTEQEDGETDDSDDAGKDSEEG